MCTRRFVSLCFPDDDPLCRYFNSDLEQQVLKAKEAKKAAAAAPAGASKKDKFVGNAATAKVRHATYTRHREAEWCFIFSHTASMSRLHASRPT